MWMMFTLFMAFIPVIRRFRDRRFSYRFTFCHLNMDTKKNYGYQTSIRAETEKNNNHMSYQFVTFQSCNFFVVVAIACDRNSATRPLQVLEKVLCKRLT
jgi:hypothetical protein